MRTWLGSLGHFALLVAAYLYSYLPQRLDRTAGWLAAAMRRRRVAGTAAAMERVLGSHRTAEAFAHHRMRIEGELARMRELHRRGWRVDLSISGLDHLERGLEAGNGVILWRLHFCSSHIPLRALAEAGYRVVHLSQPFHGTLYRTWLGLRVFAPLYRKSEVKYLDERVLLSWEGEVGYLKTLMNRLENNRVVSIIGTIPGRAGRRVRVFDTDWEFATGAPALARRTGAALLPSYVHQQGPGRYQLVIEEPVEIDPTLPRPQYLAAAVGEFALRLEAAVRAHPASWNRWDSL